MHSPSVTNVEFKTLTPSFNLEEAISFRKLNLKPIRQRHNSIFYNLLHYTVVLVLHLILLQFLFIQSFLNILPDIDTYIYHIIITNNPTECLYPSLLSVLDPCPASLRLPSPDSDSLSQLSDAGQVDSCSTIWLHSF